MVYKRGILPPDLYKTPLSSDDSLVDTEKTHSEPIAPDDKAYAQRKR